MKYQFCIRFDNVDVNSAASKAVVDSNKVLAAKGYRDYTFTVPDNKAKLQYYCSLFWQLTRFFFSIKSNSIIGIQYPLLSINNVFRYFIRIAKLKNVAFFCIIHDLESLRAGGRNQQNISTEVINLNYYDALIVHNESMLQWLHDQEVRSPMVSLELFDYLSADTTLKNEHKITGAIVYAGNLNKSRFLTQLQKIENTSFNLYGPYTGEVTLNSDNVKWMGEADPETIPQILEGSFGLVWDGDDIHKCDEVLGNYLRFNNPHKCSLYFAAGLPVIAPADSAIGKFIQKFNLGFLVNSLTEISEKQIDSLDYEMMKQNVLKIKEKIISGQMLMSAIETVEVRINTSKI